MDNYWDGTLWVCIDCHMTREGDGPAEDADCEQWGLIDDTYEVTHGLAEEDHGADCTPSKRLSGYCNCDYVEFSMSDCDACGSTLGGERHAHSYRVVS